MKLIDGRMELSQTLATNSTKIDNSCELTLPFIFSLFCSNPISILFYPFLMLGLLCLFISSIILSRSFSGSLFLCKLYSNSPFSFRYSINWCQKSFCLRSNSRFMSSRNCASCSSCCRLSSLIVLIFFLKDIKELVIVLFNLIR